VGWPGKLFGTVVAPAQNLATPMDNSLKSHAQLRAQRCTSMYCNPTVRRRWRETCNRICCFATAEPEEATMLTFALPIVFPLLALAGGDPAAQPEWKVSAQKIEGAWTVVYAEIEGKKLPDKAFTDVTIKNGVLSGKLDGKERAWRLEFGPYHMLKATEIVPGKSTKDPAGGKVDQGKVPPPAVPAYVGTYIASQEYLCLALDKRGPDEKKKPKDIGSPVASEQVLAPAGTVAQPGQPGGPASGAMNSAIVLILRREGSASDKGH
jgi:hypothetical protein